MTVRFSFFVTLGIGGMAIVSFFFAFTRFDFQESGNVEPGEWKWELC